MLILRRQQQHAPGKRGLSRPLCLGLFYLVHAAADSWLRSVAVAVKGMSVACCDMSITIFASNTLNTKICVTLNLVKILCNHEVTQYFLCIRL